MVFNIKGHLPSLPLNRAGVTPGRCQSIWHISYNLAEQRKHRYYARALAGVRTGWTMAWPWRENASNLQTLGSTVFAWTWHLFQKFRFWGAPPLGWGRSAPKILWLLMVRHPAKFSRGWNIDSGMKIFECWGARPLRVGLTVWPLETVTFPWARRVITLDLVALLQCHRGSKELRPFGTCSSGSRGTNMNLPRKFHPNPFTTF